MKAAVPGTAKISKEAKECVQECVSEFISFITSEAAEKCQMEKRKTIGGEDILYGMVTLGFENYAETLKIHLAKLRQVCGQRVVLVLFLLNRYVLFVFSTKHQQAMTSHEGEKRAVMPRPRKTSRTLLLLTGSVSLGSLY